MKAFWQSALTAVLILVLDAALAQEDGGQSSGDNYNLVPHVPEGCNDIRIFSARGSNEPYPGRGGQMLGAICALFESNAFSCDYEDIAYPAMISSSGMYCESANIGANAAREQMSGHVSACPETRIILLGYSQGASVVCDVVGGGGASVFGCEQPSNDPLDRGIAPGSNSKSTSGASGRTVAVFVH
jgi:hypothetical protein